ncbi:MAG: type IX secretion system membrane protein PorP/SprF [Bacteroidota bacterium]
MKKKNYIYALFLLTFGISFAQQDPEYTQYMYNMSVINPGYATNDPCILNVGGIYRTQWVGVEGAPKTGSIFLHAPISDKLETGLTIVNDKIGDGIINETTIAGDLAYVVNLNGTSKLSFGTKLGINLFNTTIPPPGSLPGQFYTNQLNDPAFQNLNQSFLNLGAGMFYFSDRYYLGLSVPNFLPNKQLKDGSGIRGIGVDEMHIFFTGGYVFQLSPNVKLKPAFMTKVVSNSPLAVDVTANVLLYDKFEIGAAYRLQDSFSGLVNYRITSQLRVGYAYDYTISNLSQFNSGSHEILILYNLDFCGKKGYDKSPRFF